MQTTEVLIDGVPQFFLLPKKLISESPERLQLAKWVINELTGNADADRCSSKIFLLVEKLISEIPKLLQVAMRLIYEIPERVELC